MSPLLRKIVFLSFILVLVYKTPVGWGAPASPWTVRVWQTGLPNNHVSAIVQTSDRYLWVAAETRLLRFDGVEFEDQFARQYPGAFGEQICSLVHGRDDTLWAVTRRKLIRVRNGKLDEFENAIPDALPQSLVEDSEGSIWLSNREGAVWRRKASGEVTRFTSADGLPDGRGCSLIADKGGHVWFARGGSVGIYRNNTMEVVAKLDALTARLAMASNGGIWVSSGVKLYWCSESGELKDCGSFKPRNPRARPYFLLEDRTGAVWIGTMQSGLYRYDGRNFEAVPTSHRQIEALFEDSEGNIWAGTLGGGLNQVQPRAISVQGGEAALPNESVQSVCEDVDGNLWARSQDGMLVKYTAKGWVPDPINDKWPDDVISCVATQAPDILWIATRNGRVYRSSGTALTSWDKKSGISSHTLRAILVSKSGDVWIGGDGPVSLMHIHDGQVQQVKFVTKPAIIRALVEDRAGDIWVGCDSGRLFRVSHQTVTDESANSEAIKKDIRSLYVDPDGILWIGYLGGGLGCFKDGRLARIGESQGLADNRISQMVADGRGWMWFGGASGIFKVRQAELQEALMGQRPRVHCVGYGVGDGLPNLHADFDSPSSALRRADGQIWMPMSAGMAVINPENLRDDLEAPPVLIKKILVDDREIHQNSIKETNLRLPPDHHRLQFKVAALSFRAPENVQYRYRLIGFDNIWTDAKSDRTVSYPQLPAGRYRFEVTACNSDGVWNENGASMGFTVTPFIWQEWWFRIGGLGAFSGIVTVIARQISYRRLRLKLRALQQQAALNKERARIARDIHDDLGGRLTQIVLLSGLGLQERGEPVKTAERLRAISAAARDVIKAFDETVWAINPRHDRLPDLLGYIGQVAVEFLRMAGIQCELDLPDHPPDWPVSAEARHNLFLVVKEALTNTVRHAEATAVKIAVQINSNSMTISIQDNGRGLDATPADNGADGLRNMQSRMAEIGGRFEIESERHTGSSVLLHYVWPQDGHS